MLKIKEICTLVRQCKASGVKELKFGDLHIAFDVAPAKMGSAIQYEYPQPEILISGEKQNQSVEKQIFESEKEAIKRNQLDLLAIEDPVVHEQFLLAGALEDEEAFHSGA